MDHDDFYFIVLNLGSVPQEFNFGEIFLHLTFKRMKIIAKKFEKNTKTFKKRRFATVAVVVSRAP